MPKVPCLVRGKDRNWGLRRRVPDDLRPILRKREIWRSYGAVSFAEAKARHPREMAAVEALFARARGGATPAGDARLPPPTEADIQAVAAAWFYAEEKARSLRDRAALYESPADRPSMLEILAEDEAFLSRAEGEEPATRDALAALKAAGFSAPPRELQGLVVSLFQLGAVETIRRSRDRWEGRGYEAARDPAFSRVLADAPAPPPPRRPGLTFSALCDRYLDAPERAAIAEKTRGKYRGLFFVLCDLVGAEKPVETVTREECRRAQADLLALPANLAKRYPGLSAREAAARAKEEGVPPMEGKSVRNYLDLLAALFRWAARETIIPVSLATVGEGLSNSTASKVTAGRVERRRPFTTDELNMIFRAPLFSGCKDDGAGYATPGSAQPRRGRFFVPFLAVFGGLRLNEACQLRTADVQEVDGLPMLFIQAISEGQQLKTAAAVRRVPVHPELLRLGFLRMVAKQQEAGVDRLFPELKPGKFGNFSDPFSRWWGRFMDSAELPGRGLVFHSFRHGFRDRMREAAIPSDIADALGGWAAVGQGAAYGAGFSAKTLAGHLSRVAYTGLSLDHLYLASGGKP